MLPDLQRQWNLADGALGWATSAVQLGFIAGTLAFALLAIADRHSPRKVFFALVSLGPAIAWMGVGLIAFPLSGSQFKSAFEEDRGFGHMWSAFPPVWKLWFALTLAVMAAGFTYAIMVAG